MVKLVIPIIMMVFVISMLTFIIPEADAHHRTEKGIYLDTFVERTIIVGDELLVSGYVCVYEDICYRGTTIYGADINIQVKDKYGNILFDRHGNPMDYDVKSSKLGYFAKSYRVLDNEFNNREFYYVYITAEYEGKVSETVKERFKVVQFVY